MIFLDLFEFINSNPCIVKKAKECQSFEELHKLIIENKVELNDISESDLYQLIKESQKQNQQTEDELFENVAGGSNRSQRKLQDKIKEETDPSVRTGYLGEGITLEQVVINCQQGDEFDNYYKDTSDGLYYRLN